MSVGRLVGRVTKLWNHVAYLKGKHRVIDLRESVGVWRTDGGES